MKSIKTAIGLALSLAALLPCAAFAGSGDIVTLETFMVAASQNDPWQYAATPGFEVLSRCPADFTESYVRALQRSAAAKYAVLPEDFWARLATPMKIILYNKEPVSGNGSTADIDLVAAPMDNANWGSISAVRSLPIEAGDGDTYMNCGNYWSVISDPNAPVDLNAKDKFSVDPDGRIRVANHAPKFPAWFEVGLKGPYGVYRSSLAREKWNGEPVVILPTAVWVSRDQTAALKMEAHHHHPSRAPEVIDSTRGALDSGVTADSEAAVRPADFLSLPDLFAGRGLKQHEAVWKSEAALFVRWGLFAEDPDGKEHRAAFIQFVRRATAEPFTEKLFRECFGVGTAEGERRLEDYLPKAIRSTVSVPVPASDSGAVGIRIATKVEVARILGDWTRFEGYSLRMSQPALCAEYVDHAARLFEQSYDRGERDPLFLAAMGLWALQRDDARAESLLAAATTAGVVRPRAYLALARLRYQDALPYPAKGIGDLGAEDYASLLNLLATARAQMPALLEADQLTMEVLEHAPALPTRERLAVLPEILQAFPRDPNLVNAAAHLYQRSGFAAEAAAIRAKGLALAETDEARAILSP